MSAYNTNDPDLAMSAIRSILHEPALAISVTKERIEEAAAASVRATDTAKARVTGMFAAKRKVVVEKRVSVPKAKSDQSRMSAVMRRNKWATTPMRKHAY